jgi:hypothetical protein
MRVPYRLGPPVRIRSDEFGGVLRIGKTALNTVVFFGVPSPREGVDFDYGGTGFLVAALHDRRSVPFLVTNRHVAEHLEKHEDTGFTVRANTKDGKAEPIPCDKIDWFYPNDKTVDLAAAYFSLDKCKYAAQYYAIESAQGLLDTQDFPRRGDFISIVGLFRLRHGVERNMPIVHSGHIAALPDPGELIPTENQITGETFEAEAYLVEAQTLDGLSGSPVFAHEMFHLEQLQIPAGANRGGHPYVIGHAKLIGLWMGSWDGKPGEILAADRNFKGNVRVPVGMGLVCPSEKIIDLIMKHPKAKTAAKKHIAKLDKSAAASTDYAAKGEQTASDDKPTHKEDFTRLLNAAARKREQED